LDGDIEMKQNNKTSENNKLKPEDRSVHDWYRFVLSFPPHLIRAYLTKFGIKPGNVVLDPFCGTGTTLVECKKLGISSIGIEANPPAFFASQAKVNWEVDPELLMKYAQEIAELAIIEYKSKGLSEEGDLPLFGNNSEIKNLRSLAPDSLKLLLKNSISPIPLHKVLVLLDLIFSTAPKDCLAHLKLALMNAAVYKISNLNFGPEVGAIKNKRIDPPVVSSWMTCVMMIADDLRNLNGTKKPDTIVHLADSRDLSHILTPKSIDAVITSPPYPNEKDYTRTTRLESVLLGFLSDSHDLKALKKGLIRSNTRNVYKDDKDHIFVENNKVIQRIAETIEKKRIELHKTSGFEKQYSKVTKLYFGGMIRHLSTLRQALRPGAKLAYVVGDQASYFRVMIKTGQILADIAQSLGYEVLEIDLFRTRLATATKEQLREEVLILKWPGKLTEDAGKNAGEKSLFLNN
jgi:DNA modification methylase